jgi:hypothetical protein
MISRPLSTAETSPTGLRATSTANLDGSPRCGPEQADNAFHFVGNVKYSNELDDAIERRSRHFWDGEASLSTLAHIMSFMMERKGCRFRAFTGEENIPMGACC